MLGISVVRRRVEQLDKLTLSAQRRRGAPNGAELLADPLRASVRGWCQEGSRGSNGKCRLKETIMQPERTTLRATIAGGLLLAAQMLAATPAYAQWSPTGSMGRGRHRPTARPCWMTGGCS